MFDYNYNYNLITMRVQDKKNMAALSSRFWNW